MFIENPQQNYFNAYVYLIVSKNNPEKCYIGSTTMNPKLRFQMHKANYRYYKKGGAISYNSCYEIFDQEPNNLNDVVCRILFKNTYHKDYFNKRMLHDKEKEFITNLVGVVNRYIPRDKKEYYENNKNRIKQYYQDNKDKLKKASLERYYKLKAQNLQEQQ